MGDVQASRTPEGAAPEHECVFVEEQEPSGRLVLPPCLVCGLTAMDALARLRSPDAYLYRDPAGVEEELWLDPEDVDLVWVDEEKL